MAIIRCIECGKEFSDRAKACPVCGCPTSAMAGGNSVSDSKNTYGISSEEAAKKMKAAVEEAKRSARAADSEFDRANAKVQRMASTTMGLFDHGTVSRVADISMEAKRACDTLYSALQMAVLTLDGTCRPLLAANPSEEAIREVYKEIKQLNSDSEISNTFNASVNYDNLGDIATRRYSPSLDAKMIETFWRTECDKITEEKKEKERVKKQLELDKQKKKREAFQSAHKNEIETYAKKAAKTVSFLATLENDAFNKKKEEIAKARETEKAKLEAEIVKKTQDKISALEEKRDVIEKSYVHEVVTSRAYLDEKKKALSEHEKCTKFGKRVLFELGFSKDTATNTLHTEIETLVGELQTLSNDYKAQLENVNKELKANNQEKTKSIDGIAQTLDKRFPLPEKVKINKTEVVTNAGKTPVQIVNESMKDAIYEYLLTSGLQTIDEICENCPEVCDMTLQRVSALVRQLVTEGRVERQEDKRRAYFSAVDTFAKKKKEAKKNTDVFGELEKIFKRETVSFSQLKVPGEKLEDYEKYGYLKIMASEGKLYCEQEDDDLAIFYIPEEYRK